VSSNAGDEVRFSATYPNSAFNFSSVSPPSRGAFANCNLVAFSDLIYRSDPTRIFTLFDRSQANYVDLAHDDVGDGPVVVFSHSFGMNGAMFQMIAHGISSAGMFFLVGVIYDRAHHRNLNNFRGLMEPMPLYGGISAIIFFAALGLPGLCGFVGEFMVVLATWNYDKVFAILSALTVVVTAAYILWTIQRVYMGTNAAYKDFPDITLRELICIVPLVILAVVLGVAPQLLLSWMEPSVTGLVNALAQVVMPPR